VDVSITQPGTDAIAPLAGKHAGRTDGRTDGPSEFRRDVPDRIEKTAHDKMRTGAHLNGDNLRISTAYLRISDHCRVRVRIGVKVWVMVRSGSGSGLELRLGLGLGLGLQTVVYKLLEKATKCGSIT